MKQEIYRRIKITALIVSILMLGLAFRVYVIQIRNGASYAAMARAQQRIPLLGADERGMICDRKGLALTGERLEYIYILPVSRMDEEAQRLVDALKRRGGRERKTSNRGYRIITAESYAKNISEKLKRKYGAYILRLPQRYAPDQTAVYLLGYARSSDGKGVSGLEKAFDDWLSKREEAIYGLADGANRILPGYGVQNKKERSFGLMTTLDRELQKNLENIVNQVEEGRCCAIVTQAATGDILACATAPGFSPFRVEELLESENRELLDIALQGQYPPGSVFKIVVAAAALEAGICTPHKTFTCTGSQRVGGIDIACTAHQGHGELTMEEAFSVSCNCVFIQMGELVGAKDILAMAKRLGLGREVLTNLNMESCGRLTKEQEAAGAGIGNLSIGQGSLLVTPLQLAQLTQTVANGGVFTGLYLADALKEGETTVKLPRSSPVRVMKQETAEALLFMMKQTARLGTAKSLKEWDCGGKTGSAEGVFEGNKAVHAWFTGVVPAENPQFGITVFVENGGSGGKTAVPVFESIMEKLKQ